GELGQAKEVRVEGGDLDEAVQSEVDFGGNGGADGEDEAVVRTRFEEGSCMQEQRKIREGASS
ncbi:hypothetical protein ACJBV3_10195, partial [Streptococcus suis]